jgi:hypothetical protein
MSEPDISNIGGGFLCGEEHSLTGEKMGLVRGFGPYRIFRVCGIGGEVTKGLAVVQPRLFGIFRLKFKIGESINIGLFE